MEAAYNNSRHQERLESQHAYSAHARGAVSHSDPVSGDVDATDASAEEKVALALLRKPAGGPKQA
jgi:hypothetical protein